MPFNPPTGNTQTGNGLDLYELALPDNILQAGDILQVTQQQEVPQAGAINYTGFLNINFETFTITDPKNPSEQIPLPSGQYCITQMVFINNSVNATVRTYQQQTVATWNAEQYALTKDRPSGPDACLSGYGSQGCQNGFTFPNSIVVTNQQASINGIPYLAQYTAANQIYGPINNAAAAITVEGTVIDASITIFSQGCFTYLGPNNVAALASYQIVTPPYHR